MNLQELAQKKDKISKYGRLGIAALVCFVVSPIIFAVLKGAVGLTIAAIFSAVVVNFAPWLGDKLANWKLKAIKAEAQKNPIETLQNVFIRREADKEVVKQRITDFRTSVESYSDKLDGFKENFPADAHKFEKHLTNMRRVLARRETKYQELCEDLRLFEAEIQRADAVWQMGLESEKLSIAAGNANIDYMDRIRKETAIDAVTSKMNRSFSEMETELLEEVLPPSAEPLAVGHSEPNPLVLDVQATTVKVPVK